MTKLFDKLMTKARKKGVAEHKVLAKNVMGYHLGSVNARENDHIIQWRLVIYGDYDMIYLYHYGTLIFYYNAFEHNFYYYGEGTTDTRYINLIVRYCNLDVHFRTKMDEGTYLSIKDSNPDDCKRLVDDERVKSLPRFHKEVLACSK